MTDSLSISLGWMRSPPKQKNGDSNKPACNESYLASQIHRECLQKAPHKLTVQFWKNSSIAMLHTIQIQQFIQCLMGTQFLAACTASSD